MDNDSDNLLSKYYINLGPEREKGYKLKLICNSAPLESVTPVQPVYATMLTPQIPVYLDTETPIYTTIYDPFESVTPQQQETQSRASSEGPLLVSRVITPPSTPSPPAQSVPTRTRKEWPRAVRTPVKQPAQAKKGNRYKIC